MVLKSLVLYLLSHLFTYLHTHLLTSFIHLPTHVPTLFFLLLHNTHSLTHSHEISFEVILSFLLFMLWPFWVCFFIWHLYGSKVQKQRWYLVIYKSDLKGFNFNWTAIHAVAPLPSISALCSLVHLYLYFKNSYVLLFVSLFCVRMAQKQCCEAALSESLCTHGMTSAKRNRVCDFSFSQTDSYKVNHAKVCAYTSLFTKCNMLVIFRALKSSQTYISINYLKCLSFMPCFSPLALDVLWVLCARAGGSGRKS